MFTNESWDMTISGGEMVWSSDAYTATKWPTRFVGQICKTSQSSQKRSQPLATSRSISSNQGSPENLQIQTNVPELQSQSKRLAASSMAPAPRTLPMTARLQAGTIKALKWCVLLIHASNPPPGRAALVRLHGSWTSSLCRRGRNLSRAGHPMLRQRLCRLRPAAWLLEIALPYFPPPASPWVDRWESTECASASCNAPSCEERRGQRRLCELQ